MQAVRRVLTAPRSAELFGFPPIPCHSMQLRPPRMHPYLVRKKVIHCKTRHRIITRNGTSASNEEGRSYNSTCIPLHNMKISRCEIYKFTFNINLVDAICTVCYYNYIMLNIKYLIIIN